MAVWAVWGFAAYYRGVIDKISRHSVKVWFDDGCKSRFSRGNIDLEGAIVIDRLPREEELKDGTLVLVTMPKKVAMYKAKITKTTRSRGKQMYFGVHLVKVDQDVPKLYYRRPKDIRLFTSYSVKENSAEEHVEPSCFGKPQQCLLNTSPPLDCGLNNRVFGHSKQCLMDATIHDNSLNKPLSPEIVWGNKSLISWQSPEENSGMVGAMNAGIPPPLHQPVVSPQEPSTFDPLRYHYVPNATSLDSATPWFLNWSVHDRPNISPILKSSPVLPLGNSAYVPPCCQTLSSPWSVVRPSWPEYSQCCSGTFDSQCCSESFNYTYTS